MHAVVSRSTTVAGLARGSRRAQNARRNAKMPTIRANVSTSTRVVAATRATRANRAASVLARGFSVESDVIDPIKATISDVQSVSGIKRVVERACLYGAFGVFAFTAIQAMHFGGAGIDAVMKAAHLPGAPVTVLGPVANALLMTRAGAYLQAAAAAAGALGVDYEDIPAMIGSLVFVLAGVCVWGGSGLGVTDALVRNAQGYHLALGGLLALKVRRFRNWLPGAQAELIRKVAYAGPGLLMSLIIIQGISLGSFDKMGMAGPGVLGPVAALLFNPITHFVNLYASLNYLTGAETKRSSFVMALVQIVAGVSLVRQLTQPYGNALALMHLAIGLGLLRECTPGDSLIPDLS